MRLVHLDGHGCIVDLSSTQALKRDRFSPTRSQEHALRSVRDDDRSVLESISLSVVRKAKGVVKLHTLLSLRGVIPAFTHISDGKMHEVNVLDFLAIKSNVLSVIDLCYLDYTRFYWLH